MKEDPNFVAGWLESESSLEKTFICETFGIDPARFFYMEHDRNDAGEGALDKLEAIMSTGALDLVAINSLKCLVPKEEMNASLKDAKVAIQARMNARMTRKFTSLIAEGNAAFVVVTHLSTDIGSMSHDPLIISGGHAIAYASALTLDFRRKSLGEKDPISKDEGMKIGVTIKKNHCVPYRNPYVKTDYYVVFNQGVEKYLELLDYASKQGILYVSGAWIKELDPKTGEPKEINGVKYAWNGKTAFRNFLKVNPEYFKELQDKVSGLENMSVEEISEIEQDEDAIKGMVPEDIIEEVTNKKKKK